MKSVIAFLSVIAIASAGVVLTNNLGYTYGSVGGLIASPISYAAAPIAPIAYSVPAIQSGYVAATRGSLHTAPLPEGPFAFSHHLNTAPAPGTL